MNRWMKCMLVTASCFTIAVPFAAYAAVIPEGISIGGQDLGGLDEDAANEKLEEYIDGLSEQTITIDIEGSAAETTASDLGLKWANDDVVEEVIDEYGTGDIIERYFKVKDVQAEPVDIDLDLVIDKGALSDFVQSNSDKFLTEPVDASITREDGEFVITPSKDGYEVDINATIDALNEQLADGLDEPVVIEAVVEEVKPEKTTELLSEITDVLGTYTTDFSSSGTSRSTNLRVAAEKMNGILLMPGETLSGYEVLTPFTEENGYMTAATYENGVVVDSVGGGVCQIATTLYNAALLAEMEITQRQNHSMIVTYVPPSNDAAIAGTYKDIKVTNNYDTPLYVEAYTENKKLTFTIYGKETRPKNRTIEYVSETLSTKDPGAAITKYDSSLAPGARVQEQSSHRGITSRLWKYVYVDGEQTEAEILHTDTYEASPAIYRVGPARSSGSSSAAAPAAAPETAAETQAPETEAAQPAGYGPGYVN